MPSPDTSAYRDATEAEELRRQLTATQQKLQKLRSEQTALVEAVHEGAKDAMLVLGKVPAVKPPAADTRKGKPEVALWHLTDWQGAKLTTSYNSEVMRERVLRYCDKAARLTEIQRADHPVRECVILFGGDLGEGLFNFPSQPFEIDATLMGQFMSLGRLVADVVRHALATYEKVTVVVEYGNHGRIGSKRAAVPRSDNFDRMIGAQAKAILSDPLTDQLPERLTWQESEEDIQHFSVGNYNALLIHGDEIGRNGYASPNTVIGHVKGWRAGAYELPFWDVYSGHVHRHDEYALPWGGSFFITASPESDNRYARDTMASGGSCSQRLHFVEPSKGRVTAQYRVSLAK